MLVSPHGPLKMKCIGSKKKEKKKGKLYFFLKPYLEGWVPKRIIEKNLKLQTIFILML